jgi:hypothetical protein
VRRVGDHQKVNVQRRRWSQRPTSPFTSTSCDNVNVNVFTTTFQRLHRRFCNDARRSVIIIRIRNISSAAATATIVRRAACGRLGDHRPTSLGRPESVPASRPVESVEVSVPPAVPPAAPLVVPPLVSVPDVVPGEPG